MDHMKKFLSLSFLMTISIYAICQTTSSFAADADKAFARIKEGAFKNGYEYLIKFGPTREAAINVKPNTAYVIFFVYDNTNHPAPDFQVHLMTPDSALQKKYTLKPYDRAQIGVARAFQLQYRTPQFTAGETRPVKLEAKPDANIYVFYKK